MSETRRRELWRKWYQYEPFTTEEMEEALTLRVGLDPGAPLESDPRWPRLQLLWTKALRARSDARELPWNSEDHQEAMALGIHIQYPRPSDEEIERQSRRNVLHAKRFRGEPFTREDCDEAIACEYLSREEVEEYLNFQETVRKHGFEPCFQGGIECRGVRILQ